MTLHQVRDNYPREVRVVFKHNPLPFHAQADLASMASIAAQEQGKFWEMHDRLFGIGSPKEPISQENVLKWARQIRLDLAKFQAALAREANAVRKAATDAAAVLAKTWDVARVRNAAGALAETRCVERNRRAAWEAEALAKNPGGKVEWASLPEEVQRIAGETEPVSRGTISQRVSKTYQLAEFDDAFRKALATSGSLIDEDIALAARYGARSTPTFYVNGRLLQGALPYEEFRKIIDEELKKKGLAPPPTAGDPPKPYLKAAVGETSASPGKSDGPMNVGEVPIGNSPVTGKADAPVTIAEITDFESPFCTRGAAILRQILDNYPGEVRLVFKHNPLAFHPLADVAHMASIAAHEQGKFWEMYERLFGISAPRQTISRNGLLRDARALGLDMKRFEDSLSREEGIVRAAANAAAAELDATWEVVQVTDSSGKPLESKALRKGGRAAYEADAYKRFPGGKLRWTSLSAEVGRIVSGVEPVSRAEIANRLNRTLQIAEFRDLLKKHLGTRSAIDQDLAWAERIGCEGTPSFVINGRLVKGAKPYDELRKIIDGELARKGRKPPASAGNPPRPELVRLLEPPATPPAKRP